MIYLLHGPDTFGTAEVVAELKAQLAAEDPFVDLNTSELDGRGLGVDALQATADALPFMGKRRLVIVRDLVARCNPQGGDAGRTSLIESLLAWLPRMSATTWLVLVDETLAANNPVLKWAEAQRSAPQGAAAVTVRHFPAPALGALPAWLAARAQAAGGTLEPAAATALAEALTRAGVADLHLAASELEKLLTYAGARAVTAEDVAYLVTPVSLDKVFALTNALAARDGRRAATLLVTFLHHGEAPLRLHALVVRQIRQLLTARALLDEGVPLAAVTDRLGVPPFVAGKLAQQARRFSVPFLTAALRQLAEDETAVKTGQLDATLALELFVARLCGIPRDRHAGGSAP